MKLKKLVLVLCGMLALTGAVAGCGGSDKPAADSGRQR